MSAFNNNMKTSFGNPEDNDGQVQLELLTQKNLYLQQVKELTAMYGAEKVLEFMQLGGLIPTTPKNESIDSSLLDTKSQESNSADLFAQVETLGLTLNPLLINLISTSTVAQVKIAIAKYKTYRQVINPQGLFYRILINERK